MKLKGVVPAHTDLQPYFKVTPPSVIQVAKILESNGFIQKNILVLLDP